MAETLPSIVNSIDPKWISALASDGHAPVAVCREIVERAGQIGAPIGNLEGLEQAKRFVGTYPYQAHDADNYLAGMASVMAEHPLRIVQKAIDRQTRKTTRALLPTRAELQETINEVLRDRWKIITRARAIVERHDALIERQRTESQRDQERRAMRETLGDAWNDWWSIQPITRRYTGTMEQFAEGWSGCKNDEARKAFTAAWGTTGQSQQNGTAA